MRSLAVVLALGAAAASGAPPADDPRDAERIAAEAYARKDYEAAFAIFLAQARSGDPLSQVLVGHMLRDGLGVERDEKKAAFWYEQAHDQGDANGSFNLAVMIETGRGVRRDFERAGRYYLSAANGGHPGAQYNVAWLIRRGRGFMKDEAGFYYWYRRAEANGNGLGTENDRWLDAGRMLADRQAMRTGSAAEPGAARGVAPVVARAPATAEFGRFHALVISNQAYVAMARLATPHADGDAVARLLETRYGFQVRRLRDASRLQLLDAIQELRAQLKETDNLLVYYAGHGQIDAETQRGYWMPVDADPARRSTWCPHDDITNELKGMRARHVLVVADSCFAGALVRSGRDGPAPETAAEEWVRRMASKRSRTVLTSGGREPVLDAGGEGHSVFARAFLAALEQNDRPATMEALFQERIGRKVVLDAEQTPRYADLRLADHELGDFVLVPVGAALPAAPGAR